MVKVNTSNPRNAGRHRKYKDEVLLKIIHEYMVHEFKDEINASQIAQYAKDKMGYKGIKYYHFTQQDAAMAKITEIIEDSGKARRGSQISSVTSFQNIEIDAFYHKYGNNEFKLKNALLHIQNGEKQLYNNLIKSQNENNDLENKVNDLLKQIDFLHSDARVIRKENSDLKKLNKALSKLIDVQDHKKMCKFVLSNTGMDGDLGEQYLLSLLECKVIKAEDAEEIKDSVNQEPNEELNQSAISDNKIIELFKQKTIERAEQEDEEDEAITMDQIQAILRANDEVPQGKT